MSATADDPVEHIAECLHAIETILVALLVLYALDVVLLRYLWSLAGKTKRRPGDARVLMHDDGNDAGGDDV